jgi:hypothetical protein
MRHQTVLTGAYSDSISEYGSGLLSFIGNTSDVELACTRRISDITGWDVDWKLSMLVVYCAGASDVVLRFDTGVPEEWAGGMPIVECENVLVKALAS